MIERKRTRVNYDNHSDCDPLSLTKLNDFGNDEAYRDYDPQKNRIEDLDNYEKLQRNPLTLKMN